MKLFWTPMLATGVTWQDEQHRELFHKINELIEVMEKKQDGMDVTGLVGFLDNYVKTHFAEEERAMASLCYPAATTHKNEHKAFVADIARIKLELNSQKRAGAIDLRKRLASWLFDHIGKDDRSLGAHILKKSPQATKAKMTG